MAALPDEVWIPWLRGTLASYDERVLRQVASGLCRPRNRWPVDELLERILAALVNPVMLDRRLKDLRPAARRLLALMARSRQQRWPVGTLVELSVCLGDREGLAPVQELLESGLLVPVLIPVPRPDQPAQDIPTRRRLQSFETWLALGTPVVVAPPLVLQRALHQAPELPDCPGAVDLPDVRGAEADGLEWPLRLAVLWQQTLATPLRRTQQGGFFKRDFDRLKNDPLLSAPPTDALAPLPDPGFLTAALATATGLLEEADSELRSASFPPAWNEGLPALLAELWSALVWLAGWNAATGEAGSGGPGNPYPSAYLLAVLLLSQLGDDAWADPAAIEEWLAARHPYWPAVKDAASGAAAFLLGVAYPLRIVQAHKQGSAWRVRLSPLGRWLLGQGEAPAVAVYAQTLLVQPNLEILAYRQGLTPELIQRLTRLATWKGLGAACTLQLEPHSVYRAFESGESFDSAVQLLERHGMKAVPPAVLDSLRTWSNKRERISIYAAAALFEFGSAAELTEALRRGLPALRLTDRLAVVANEKEIDYRHFRLTGTRDYCLPPERCVAVEPDGVTLAVDLARSDLMLESELQRFAEPVARPRQPGLYRLTPGSLRSARQNGLTEANLEVWFRQRTGQALPAAARLLLAGPETPAPELRRQLVLHVAGDEIADGLQQWPATAELIVERVGPAALVVAEENVAALTERLREIGIRVEDLTAMFSPGPHVEAGRAPRDAAM